ncbi:MAG TPA: DUF2249 domain-containing protein [Gammaproteobacteria bacterium]|nr:DUF2249 domain-containing protein [Gammaproteobacteria bacterium]
MNEQSSECLLDVTALEPPEPLERALEALEHLRPGQYLRLLLRREPFPLYALLDEDGFLHLGRRGEDSPYEVFVWRRGDAAAETAVGEVAGE